MNIRWSRKQWTIVAGALMGVILLLLLIPKGTTRREFRLSNGDVVVFIGMTCGTNHCDPELPVLQRFLVPLQRRGKIPARFGSLLRSNVIVIPTKMPADVLWFKMPPPFNPRLYLIGRLIDEKGNEFDRPYNFFSFGTNAVLIFPHSLPGRERLTKLHLSESDFPNQDTDFSRGSFYTPISAPERDVASVPAVELGLKH
jgi:hypothetical protein